jgi:hypothetical protein
MLSASRESTIVACEHMNVAKAPMNVLGGMRGGSCCHPTWQQDLPAAAAAAAAHLQEVADKAQVCGHRLQVATPASQLSA